MARRLDRTAGAQLMVWARFDDRFPWHRKVRGCSDKAFRLHVEAICWSNEQITDGHVPAAELDDTTTVRQPHRVVAELVRRGMWDTAEGGWMIHDFLVYNLSAERVRKERDRARQKRLTAKKSPWGRPADAPSDRPDLLTGARPGPSRPDPAAAAADGQRQQQRSDLAATCPVVAWDLEPDHWAVVDGALDRCGVALLAQVASQRAGKNPPGSARAWLTLWANLTPKPRPAERGMCDIHGSQLSSIGVCSGCEAERKAAR